MKDLSTDVHVVNYDPYFFFKYILGNVLSKYVVGWQKSLFWETVNHTRRIRHYARG